MIGISGSLSWSKALMKLIFNPCGEFRWSTESPVSQIHSPHFHARAPVIFSELLRSVQMLKRDWGWESNGKLPHLFVPSKIATLVPEFAVEDLPLSRTATLVREVAVKDLPFGGTLMIFAGFMAQAVRRSHLTTGVPSSHLDHSMWVSLWTKRVLGRFFSGFLPFSLSTNFIPAFLHTHLIHFVSFLLPL